MKDFQCLSIFSVFSIRLCPRFVRCLSVVLLLSMGLADLARLWLNRQLMTQGPVPRKEYFWDRSQPLGGGPEFLFPLYFIPSQSRFFQSRTGKKARKTGKKPKKPEKTGKNRKNRKKPENRKKRKNRKKTEKTGKNRKKKPKNPVKADKNWKSNRREKGSQNIKVCRIENTLKLVTSP